MRASIGLLGGTLLLGLTGSAFAAPDLPDGQVVTLADGDQFTVSVSGDFKTVWGRRYDATTGTWGQPSVVFTQENVFCGDVDARAAGNAVAVTAECAEGGWSQDQTPTHSQALYSPDTVSWQSFTLPGETFEEPGISPSGTAAIWPLFQGWVTYTSDGFKLVQRELPGQGYTITGTIADSGDVSILYGNEMADDCVLSVLNVSTTGAETHQQLDVNNACMNIPLANADAFTVILGMPNYPEYRATMTRPDTASPWTVTGAPADAPGLVSYRGKGTAVTLFPQSPGLPLLAVGSPDRKTWFAQTFDPVSHSWALPVPIRSASTRCKWGDNYIHSPFGVFALQLRCDNDVRRVLVSVDGVDWDQTRLRSPLGLSPDHKQVSISSKTRTVIYSRERGQVTLRLGASGPCDAVLPVSPTEAIRLTTTSERGWPDTLERSTAHGWKRTRTAFPRPRAGRERCTHASLDVFLNPMAYTFTGNLRDVTFSVLQQGNAFRIKKFG